jgi:hypothetical protein
VMNVPAQIYHIPSVFMKSAPKQPADDTALLIECMDLLSKRLCGCISAILPTEDHAVFLGSVEQLLDGLERNRLARMQGRAN